MRRLHADECRERAEVRGSGPDARKGLWRYRDSRSIPLEPEERETALAFPRPAPTERAANIGPLVNAILGLPNPDAQVGGRNPKSIIREMVPRALEEFNRIYKKEAPKLKLEEKAERLADRLEDRFFLIDFRTRCEIEEKEINPAGVLNVGLRALETGDVFAAHEIFELLANAYLNSNPQDEKVVPHEVGTAAIRNLTAISRAWVLAQAVSYFANRCEEYEGKFKVFEPSSVLGHIWSAATMQNLAKFGELQDLAPVQFIGAECGEAAMEGYCHNASTQIKARALLMAIPLEEIAEEFGISGVSKEQLAHKLAFLLHVTNIASEKVLSKMPAFRHFSPRFANPVDGLMEQHGFAELLHAKLEIRIQLFAHVFGTGVDADWWVPSVEFLKQNSLLQEAEDGNTGTLTEKGKQLLARIVSEMMKIEIKLA